MDEGGGRQRRKRRASELTVGEGKGNDLEFQPMANPSYRLIPSVKWRWTDLFDSIIFFCSVCVCVFASWNKKELGLRFHPVDVSFPFLVLVCRRFSLQIDGDRHTHTHGEREGKRKVEKKRPPSSNVIGVVEFHCWRPESLQKFKLTHRNQFPPIDGSLQTVFTPRVEKKIPTFILHLVSFIFVCFLPLPLYLYLFVFVYWIAELETFWLELESP